MAHVRPPVCPACCSVKFTLNILELIGKQINKQTTDDRNVSVARESDAQFAEMTYFVSSAT